MDRASTGAASTQKVTRHYWRRLDEPAGGWWPWGWLPLLGLIATMFYGMFFTAPELEAQTRDGVAQALAAADLKGFNVKADGQRVLVTGAGPAALRDRLIAVARGAVCDTWLAKRVICPTHIDVDLTGPAVADTASAQVVARLHSFAFRQGDKGLLLEGEVPSNEVRARIVAEASQRFGQVIDRLTVTNAVTTEGYEKSLERAWQLLPGLDAGGVQWNDGAFSAWGRVPEEREAAIRQAFARTDQAAPLGALNLEVIPSANTCNQKFSAALTGARIQFQTGSAAIASESQTLLRQLAVLAAECPIALNVEGHTDNVGAVELNRRLSLARAEAVVAALQNLGVDDTQLTPQGYGPGRPVADNGTPEGRAQNRRIEIKASQ